MYKILYNDRYIFDPIDENEVVTDAVLTDNTNAAAYLDFTISPKHPLYNDLEERSGIVTVYYDREKLFEGEIYKIEDDFYGYRTISCSSALDYLKDTEVRPYHTLSIDDGDTSKGMKVSDSVDGYFSWLIDQHNSHMLDSNRTFVIGINQGASFKNSNLINASSTGGSTVADEIDNNILTPYGGYLFLRYDNEQRILDLYSDIHDSNAQIIDFGVNLLEFTKTTETTDQYTALILKGGSPSFVDGGFESGTFTDWPTHSTGLIATGTVHSGTYSSYFTEGNGEYINDSIFYVRSGFRYKSTVWIKNERNSPIRVYPRYQKEEAGSWLTVTVSGVNPYDVPNDGEWHEYSFDFLPGLPEGTKIRGRWVFDTVSNESNHRVYVDDFNFRRIENENDVEEDPIGIENAQDGITEYDSDIEKKDDVIYSLSAVKRYGYRETSYSDDSITDVDKLIEAGITKLHKLMAPSINIEVKAIDLALYMEGYTHLQIGQAVRIRSLPHHVDEYLVVSSIELNLQDPSQTTYELGTSYDTLTGQQSAYLKTLNSGINSSLDAVASLDQTTKDQAIQIGSVETVANQAQQTANEAQTSANNAQQTANSNKEQIDTIKDKQSEQDELIEQMKQGIADSEADISGINDRLTQMDSDVDQVQTNLDTVRQETNQTIQNVKDSVSDVKSDVDAVGQTVDKISLSLKTDYRTKADSDAIYATQASLSATSEAIKTEVSQTYATKATVDILENIANNAVQTWMGSGVPTLSNNPASDWNTDELKSQHSGDIYYDIDTGYAYRFGSSDGSNYSWALIKDTDITKALADAAKAQETADDATSGVTELQTSIPVTYATKTELSQKADSITSRVEEVAQAGTVTSNKVTQLEQTTDEIKSTVSEQGSTLDGAVQTISQVSQKADSLSSKIEQTNKYLEAVDDKADTAQTTADSSLSKISEVEQNLDGFKTNVSQTYETKTDASNKQSSLQQSVNDLRSEVSENYLSKEDADQTYSTKAYVDQTSRTVSLGVVEEYKNGQHGSALATASDITAAKDSITSSVSQTYLSKTDATNTYATKTEVTQTSDALTVKINSAASIADTAKTDAANAQLDATNANSRVGNLETCIKMTTDGVRVGKIVNGEFSGYSALVNSEGSFDILDNSNKTIVSFGSVSATLAGGGSSSIGNINSSSLAFNGVPVNFDVVTFRITNFNITNQWQHIPVTASDGICWTSIQFGSAIQYSSKYLPIMKMDSSNSNRVFISNYTGWVLCNGVIDIRQDPSKRTAVYGCWTVGDAIGNREPVSYGQEFLLLNQTYDTNEWYRMNIPMSALYLKKGQYVSYRLRIDNQIKPIPSELIIGSRTYLTFMKIPFSQMN